MMIVSSEDFRAKMFDFFKNPVGDDFIVKTREYGSFKVSIKPIDKDDVFNSIPAEYRCDPFEISPSGDPFFADRRNVDMINERIGQIEPGKVNEILPEESLDDFLRRTKSNV